MAQVGSGSEEAGVVDIFTLSKWKLISPELHEQRYFLVQSRVHFDLGVSCSFEHIHKICTITNRYINHY